MLIRVRCSECVAGTPRPRTPARQASHPPSVHQLPELYLDHLTQLERFRQILAAQLGRTCAEDWVRGVARVEAPDQDVS